jgi:hypothetical protein
MTAMSGCDRGAGAPVSASAPPQTKAEATPGDAVMTQESDWNDKSRDDLRAALETFIMGGLRLAKNDDAAILEACTEIYIEDDCPEDEQSTFVQYAADELKRAVARLEAEKSAWPAETDCDRLDRAESRLRERGILLWQASPCCDTCTYGELPDRINAVSSRHPGLRDRIRGCAFFIDQNLPEMLSDGTEIDVYLGYGWLSPDNTEVASDIYESNSLSIAHEVCECLRAEGLNVVWDGDFSKKIGVQINWQRRNMLD